MDKYIPQDGDKVRLVDDPDDGIYTVSQVSDYKCWIGDESGSGWYVYFSDIKPVEEI